MFGRRRVAERACGQGRGCGEGREGGEEGAAFHGEDVGNYDNKL